MKLSNNCRLCLDDIEYMNTIDLSKVCQKTCKTLLEKVEYCCDLKINEEDCLPSKICENCYGFLEIAFNFRRMVRNTQKYLEDVLDENDFHDVKDEIIQQDKSDCEPEESNDTQYDENVIIQFDPDEEHVDDEQCSVQEIKDSRNNATLEYTIASVPKSKTRTKRNYEKELSSYMCSICGNIYSKRAAFTYHMGQHREPTHECEICNRKFKQTCELKYHMRLHTGEKPYKCSYCERHFIDLGGKIRHERTHTDERPYECKICGRRFLYSWSCKKHELIHTGEKRYYCNICDKSFTLQHQLKAHLETIIHKQKEVEMGCAMLKEENDE